MSFYPYPLPVQPGRHRRLPSRVVLVVVLVFMSGSAPLLLVSGGMPSPEALATVAAVATFALGFTHQVLALTAVGRSVGAPADARPSNLR